MFFRSPNCLTVVFTHQDGILCCVAAWSWAGSEPSMTTMPSLQTITSVPGVWTGDARVRD